MDDNTKKTDLSDEEISKIRYILARKANYWFLSGGRESDGMEVYRTQYDDLFLLRDVETGVELGMRKEVTNNGVVTKLSFVALEESLVDNMVSENQCNG